MYGETVQYFAHAAEKKSQFLQQSPVGFSVSAMMARAYVGIGILLIFSVGGTLDPAWQKLVMGASFGIALTLVVFAGAELFTGYTMYMVLGLLQRKTGVADLLRTWIVTWVFNFAGSVLVAWLFAQGGGGVLYGDGIKVLQKVAEYKMQSPVGALLARAILCNWLVCLALWSAARCTSDSGKAIVIWWCLFAFIACGFEHSVANMTLLTVALLGPAHESIGLDGLWHNLLWVTLGNIIGGSGFVATGYWLASPQHHSSSSRPSK